MSDNIFWTCFNVCITVIVITLIVFIHLSSVNGAKTELEEHKSAIEAGLQQQLIGNKKIWVKVKE